MSGPVVFSARLTPNCSLSPRGFLILMTAVSAVSFSVGLGFFLIGAWPIVGFLGLDVLLLYLAFRASFRNARLYETVTLTREKLLVQRVSPRGDAQRWQFQPAWLQILMDDPPRHESQLRLAAKGRSLVVGSFLTPEERLDFAKALRRAVAVARRPESLAQTS